MLTKLSILERNSFAVVPQQNISSLVCTITPDIGVIILE